MSRERGSRSKGGALEHFARTEEEGKELTTETDLSWKSQRVSLEITRRKALFREQYLGENAVEWCPENQICCWGGYW